MPAAAPSAAANIDRPPLVPSVRSLRPLPGPPSGPTTLAVRENVGHADPATTAGQAYRLRIDRGTATIDAASPAAARHARATLAQLTRLHPAGLPALEIDDAPAFATRGVLLDISRNRVPTMRHLLDVLDTLAALKFNHLQLYTEHTFAYAGHETAWSGCSPITPDELTRLDSYAAERGITLAANQNCFGHLAHWLRLPAYRDLAETHGDWMFDVWPRSGPFSLCPTDPRSLALVRDWLTQLAPLVRSPLINLNADETYDVGHGRSRDEALRRGGGSVGRVALYVEFVNAVAAIARDLGKRPMFWADIALSHEASMRDLHPDLLALVWGYEGDARFAEGCRAARATPDGSRRDVWVCPGTSTWRTFTGRTAERHANLAAAATQGLAAGAEGFLACEWGDVGHRQTWPITAHALAHAAHAAWTGDAATFVPEASAIHLLGDATGALGPWLERLGDADAAARAVALPLSRPGHAGRLRNATALFADFHTPLNTGLDVPAGVFAEARANLDALARDLPPDLPPLIADELGHILAAATLAADRAIRRRAASASSGTGVPPVREVVGGTGVPPVRQEFPDLLPRLDALAADQRRLWLIRARPGGLDDSLAHTLRARDELAHTSGTGVPPVGQ